MKLSSASLFGCLILAVALLSPIGCGTSKPSDDAGASGTGGGSGSGTGGSSGTGGQRGTGGFSFDASGFDVNLDGLNLDGINVGDLNLDGLNIETCPTGVKTGDACSKQGATCVGAGKGCYCVQSTWTCFGN